MGNKLLILLLTVFLFSGVQEARGQLLMGIIFGDKLNSDKLEFGLTVGINYAYLHDLEGTTAKRGLQFGSYFYFMPREKHSIHAELLAFSDHGASDLEVYQVENQSLAEVLDNANVTRVSKYIALTLQYRYRVFNYIHLEGGWHGGLLTKAFDEFNQTIQGDEITFRRSLTDDYNRLETGPIAGLSYKFLNGEGIAVNLMYYYGLTNTIKGSGINNSSLRISVNIPIGKSKEE